MDFPTYPKIETLFERDEKTHKVIPGRYRKPEFAAVRTWDISEKIDGTNIRICLTPDGKVTFGGKTNNAQLYAPLVEYLQATFPTEKVNACFDYDPPRDVPVVIYAEGYGPRIQKGGGNYRSDVAVRLFDVRVGNIWLKSEAVADIARRLEVKSVPLLHWLRRMSETIIECVRTGFPSTVAEEDGGPGCQAEGIVARSSPLMLDRMGRRVIWKLKHKDF